MTRRMMCLGGVVGPLLLASCAVRHEFTVPPAPEPLRPQPVRPAVQEGPLSVHRAIALALARNPDISAATARLMSARAAEDAARAALNPIVATDLSYLVGDAPSAYLFKTIDARNLAPGTDFNNPGGFSNVEAGVTLRWNLWNGGRDQLGLWAAESGVGEAAASRDGVRNRLAAAVAATFLDARAAEALLSSNDASVRTVSAQVEETRAKVEGGGALRSDLLSLEVRLAEARERRIRTDVARRLALAILRHLLALPAGAPLELAPSLGGEAVSLPATVEEALAEAYRQRPEVRAARKAVERARIEVERARRARLPRVDLEARYYGDDEGLSFDRNWTAAVGLSFDLFVGGRTRARVRSARAALDRIEEEDRKALLDVALDVETSYLRLEEARARFDVASQAVGAAEETLVLVERQYRGGSATVTRYLEAESARTQARTAKIGARLALDRALVDTQRALGRLGTAGERS